MLVRSRARSPAHRCVFWLCLAAGLGCKAGESSPPDAEQCADFELDVRESWNDQTKVTVRAKFMEKGGELGAEVARARGDEVVTAMDALTRDWVMLRQAACLDHFKRGVITAEQYRTRAECLDRVLGRQRTLVEALVGSGELGDRALADLSGELDACRS